MYINIVKKLPSCKWHPFHFLDSIMQNQHNRTHRAFIALNMISFGAILVVCTYSSNPSHGWSILRKGSVLWLVWDSYPYVLLKQVTWNWSAAKSRTQTTEEKLIKLQIFNEVLVWEMCSERRWIINEEEFLYLWICQRQLLSSVNWTSAISLHIQRPKTAPDKHQVPVWEPGLLMPRGIKSPSPLLLADNGPALITYSVMVPALTLDVGL